MARGKRLQGFQGHLVAISRKESALEQTIRRRRRCRDDVDPITGHLTGISRNRKCYIHSISTFGLRFVMGTAVSDIPPQNGITVCLTSVNYVKVKKMQRRLSIYHVIEPETQTVLEVGDRNTLLRHKSHHHAQICQKYIIARQAFV